MSREFWVVPHLMHVFQSEVAARKAAVITLDPNGKPLKTGEVIRVREVDPDDAPELTDAALQGGTWKVGGKVVDEETGKAAMREALRSSNECASCEGLRARLDDAQHKLITRDAALCNVASIISHRNRGTTHYAGCELDHSDCRLLILIDEALGVRVTDVARVCQRCGGKGLDKYDCGEWQKCGDCDGSGRATDGDNDA